MVDLEDVEDAAHPADVVGFNVEVREVGAAVEGEASAETEDGVVDEAEALVAAVGVGVEEDAEGGEASGDECHVCVCIDIMLCMSQPPTSDVSICLSATGHLRQ